MTTVLSTSQVKGSVDFAIITIRDDEFRAVFQRMGRRQAVIGQQIYDFAELRHVDGGTIRVAAVRTYSQGIAAAQSVTRDVLIDLAPRWLVLVGIAGGAPVTEFSLGDVLLAESVHDFSISASYENGGARFRTGGGPMHPRVQRLLAHLPSDSERLGAWNSAAEIGLERPLVELPDGINAPSLYGSEEYKADVLRSLARNFPNGGSARDPLYRICAVASSNVLVKDSSLLQQWRECARHIEHVEMEAAGVHNAARSNQNGEIPLLCVRGISDIVGLQRSGDWTAFACESAASFAFALMTRLPREYFGQPASSDSGDPGKPPDDASSLTMEKIVAAIKDDCQRLVSRVVDLQSRILRCELEQVVELIGKERGDVVCLLGAPGSGKTSLLAEVAQKSTSTGVVTFVLRADLLEDELSLVNWGERRGIGKLSAIDAIKLVATRSKVLVVVDQLDAIASTVDLKSSRLNVVLDFVSQCSSIVGVNVLCSCRTFDFAYDSRFEAIRAKSIELSLPSWEDVQLQLKTHGVSEVERLPESFRELLRTPQHLRVFIDRHASTGNANPFASYQSMLDDLWERAKLSTHERNAINALATAQIESESLWSPLAAHDGHRDAIDELIRKGLLAREDNRIGFAHQTVRDHAIARVFTGTGESLTAFVVARQDAIFARPTLWAILRYLRDANPTKYKKDLEALFSLGLRAHVRYLLIDFLGQVQNVREHEVVQMAARLTSDDDCVRVLAAIEKSSEWFEALCATHFPIVMRYPVDRQWRMVWTLVEAFAKFPKKCLSLIDTYWISDRSKHALAISWLDRNRDWDEDVVAVACRLIDLAPNRDRLAWCCGVVHDLASRAPQFGPRVFARAIAHMVRHSDCEDSGHGQDLLEPGHREWAGLDVVANAVPREFLRECWSSYVQICEVFYNEDVSSKCCRYRGSSRQLDAHDDSPLATVTRAFIVAVEKVAGAEADEFLSITRDSWPSENALVHRMIARGLTIVADTNPDIVLEYLQGDPRRFAIGTVESHEQGDSCELVRAFMAKASPVGRATLEKLIWKWSRYVPEITLDDEQTEWDREARVRLLADVPAELLSRETVQKLDEELKTLPHWHRPGYRSRSGIVRQIPPVTKDAMREMPLRSIVAKIESSEVASSRRDRDWIEVEGGWEEAGGPASAGAEIAELAKDDPRRALEIIAELARRGQCEAAARGLLGMDKTDLADDEVFSFFRLIASNQQTTAGLRDSVASVVSARCKSPTGLPDDICEICCQWVEEAAQAPISDGLAREIKARREIAPDRPTSILWSPSGGCYRPDVGFHPLLAMTYGYLLRREPNVRRWVEGLEKLIETSVSTWTWEAFCPELRSFGRYEKYVERGRFIVHLLLEKHPSLIRSGRTAILLAESSHWLDRRFLEACLRTMRDCPEFSVKQAYGELLALFALRDDEHAAWAKPLLATCLQSSFFADAANEPVAIGIAFTAGRGWDEAELRAECANVLAQLVPHATKRVSMAIETAFWAAGDFLNEPATHEFLRALATRPSVFGDMNVSDIVPHLVGLAPHCRKLVLDISEGILAYGINEQSRYWVGADMVRIAMTLQRYDDSRDRGLTLLEDLLRRGLDDAWRFLKHADGTSDLAGWNPGRTPGRRRRR